MPQASNTFLEAPDQFASAIKKRCAAPAKAK
jgi:hypothetical protein